MSSTTPNSNSKNQNSKLASDLNKSSAPNNPQQDTLGEDDEFEDFPVENWTAAESDISSLANTVDQAKQANGGRGTTAEGHANAKKVTMDDLWEDNWDDDVIESDFAHQLRAELEKTKSNGTGPTPMQT
ncbi:hypothetical protein MJO28_015074 [Puccinia striiformis f. sp. tritici]|uniref:26S proteasome complex subunit SEM1 n=2 Tax=Puccinia striiformis TaxID=27350 RepID=A0A2S4WJN0_9BASI|nr:hypothetical protein Pst134EB_028451 [Puccinia striiformis f. sp. tritici]KAI7937523.1 hypothetical protein MJO29_014838 [Puccinia striiformis f. sp. tritici]KAI7938154.1 hypothetical protein MJO28_015074 [Puccinia striiformis f. sp. tritici]KAI9616125.1 hypothetical protein KEM48_005382 [Puccinia striiformis f. sp. tritici PST-130]POW21996.1 hypothetical protein PSHT_01741 [Puccinia striiformis]